MAKILIECEKVREETLERIQFLRSNLFGLIKNVDQVIDQSEVKVRIA